MLSETTYDSENNIWKSDQLERTFNANKSIGDHALYMLRSKPANLVCQISDSEGSELTYGTACSYAISVAAHLSNAGLGCDDVVGIVSYNTTLLMPVLVGCWINGTPFNALHPIHEEDVIRQLFALTRPKIIFCDGLCFQKVQNATKTFDVSIYTLCNHLEGVPRVQKILQPVPFEEFYQAVPLKYGPTQTMAITPTSGTTGIPKGACISNAKLMVDLRLCNGSSVTFSFASADWGTGVLTMIVNILCGGIRIITTTPYSPEYLLQIIRKHKVTFLIGSPIQLGLLSQLPQYTEDAMAGVRLILMTGGHALPSVQSRLRAKLPNCILMNSYGTSEIGGISVNYLDYKTESVGKLIAGVQIKIVDAGSGHRKRLLGPNERGEIWVRGCDNWPGYYGNPVATADTMDAEGWINTGDVGYMDDECYLYLVDRSKEVLKYMSFHYSPHEIEETVSLLPDVQDVCVFGVYDERAMDLAAAAVVLRPGSVLTEADIVKFVAEKQEVKHKHINYGVFFVDAIARNSNGKVMRAKMKEICLKMEQEIRK
ncbi:uncharacterized protein LOC129240899 [Anastrepha obliqua]|uniref:uncharacterized protein LOC129240899 n=1 Tax=Anastrepha obliqua TaxID=95512 RepID=UPI00240938DB|nr:uncharacterized protein LOC129240899 [Anastrepha obliqua]